MYQAIQNDFTDIIKALPKMKTKTPEIEIRFGKVVNNTFQSYISRGMFYDVLLQFTRSNVWTHAYQEDSIDYFIDDLRVTQVNMKDNDPVFSCMQKSKLITPKNYSNDDENDSDIRLSISAEVPRDVPNHFHKTDKNTLKQRHKQRHTFIYKNMWKYDFTRVFASNIAGELYEIEIELINCADVVLVYNAEYLAHSLILKIDDIMNMSTEV